MLQKLQSLRPTVSLRLAIPLIAAVVWVGMAAHVAVFLWPRSVSFSYAQSTCVATPTLLPGAHRHGQANSYNATFVGQKSVGGLPIYASTTCVQLTGAPADNSSQSIKLKPFGNPLIAKNITISTNALPKLSTRPAELQSGLISIKDPLVFQLDQTDATFDYLLSANKRSVLCHKTGNQLRCDTPQLGLAQAQKYQIQLQRVFKGASLDTILTQDVSTVTPIAPVSSSIAANTVAYDIPKELVITFDKPLESTGQLKFSRVGGADVQHSVTKKDTQLLITFAAPLPRNASFELTLDKVTATDKGYLAAPYVLKFSTSGGPKVVNKNIGSNRLTFNPSIVLTFDAPINPANATQFFELSSAGGVIASNVRIEGSQVVISPQRSLGLCEAITIKVKDGLVNTYGVSGGSAWQFGSRSICHTTFSIGKSVEGRDIVAYRFGSGPSKILYTAAMHGSELSSKYTVDSWVDYLENNAASIPGHRSIIVIPSINPDGVARKSRTNARGIDLNRNFPAYDWKSDVVMPGGQLLVGGGGATPLSEPESQALVSFVLAQQPRLILNYHSQAAVVNYNGAGDSASLAGVYGSKARYRAIGDEAAAGTFQYDTTGAFESWLRDKPGISTLLIELTTHSGNEFTRNQAAMWHMATLPQ